MDSLYLSHNHYTQKLHIHHTQLQLPVFIAFYMYLQVKFPFYFINTLSCYQNWHSSSLCPGAKRASWYVFSFFKGIKQKSIDNSFANWQVVRFKSTGCFEVPYFLFLQQQVQ